MKTERTDAELWERVHQVLDRREDPFADSAVQEGLLAHPHLAPEVERLCAQLDAMATAEMAPTPRATGHRWFVAAGLLAAALLAMLAPRFWSAPTAEPEVVPVVAETAADTAATAPASSKTPLRVLRFALAVQVDGATHSVEERQLRTGQRLRTETLRNPSSQWTVESLESPEINR